MTNPLLSDQESELTLLDYIPKERSRRPRHHLIWWGLGRNSCAPFCKSQRAGSVFSYPDWTGVLDGCAYHYKASSRACDPITLQELLYAGLRQPKQLVRHRDTSRFDWQTSTTLQPPARPSSVPAPAGTACLAGVWFPRLPGRPGS
jgi:hypothetical protein